MARLFDLIDKCGIHGQGTQYGGGETRKSQVRNADMTILIEGGSRCEACTTTRQHINIVKL